MALSLLLRNTIKLNGVANSAVLKSARRLSPLRTYSQLVNNCQCTIARNNHVALAKALQPWVRVTPVLQQRRPSSTGNHTPMWTLERIVSAALLGVLPAAFLVESQAIDTLMAVLIVLHTHWGLEAMAGDYLRPNNVGAFMSKAGKVSVYAISIMALAGFFYLIFNDIGVAKSIKKFWAIKGFVEKEEEPLFCYDKKGNILDLEKMKDKELVKCIEETTKRKIKESKARVAEAVKEEKERQKALGQREKERLDSEKAEFKSLAAEAKNLSEKDYREKEKALIAKQAKLKEDLEKQREDAEQKLKDILERETLEQEKIVETYKERLIRERIARDRLQCLKSAGTEKAKKRCEQEYKERIKERERIVCLDKADTEREKERCEARHK